MPNFTIAVDRPLALVEYSWTISISIPLDDLDLQSPRK
jgi:hypothetical protein